MQIIHVLSILLPNSLCPGVDSASNRNKYYGYLQVGCNGGQCIGLTTVPPLYAECLQILGASIFWILMGMSRSVMGQLYLCFLLHDRITQYYIPWHHSVLSKLFEMENVFHTIPYIKYKGRFTKNAECPLVFWIATSIFLTMVQETGESSCCGVAVDGILSC